jgi:hypothetical protein
MAMSGGHPGPGGPSRFAAALLGFFLVPVTPSLGRADACAPEDARRELARVDALIRGLRPGDDVGAANRALQALLAGPCFTLSEESARLPAPSALSLRTFWESGGEWWARSYLDRRASAGPGTQLVVPPDARPSLTAESRSERVPLDVLCPAADETCGAETRGWRLRAERFLRMAYSAHGGRKPGQAAPAAACWEEARQKPEAQRYAEWRVCLEGARPLVPVLPLGSFRAPARGWWTLTGARATQARSCNELRAYHLETGAAFIAQSCADEVLDGRGVRDAAASEATRRLQVSAGRLPVESLREFAWMAVLASQVKLAQLEAAAYPLPDGLAPRWPRGMGYGAGAPGAFWGRQNTTTLAWGWFADGPLAQGRLTWPPADHPTGEAYAAHLLQAVEGAFLEGCPPARVPSGVLPPDAPPELAAALGRPVDCPAP